MEQQALDAGHNVNANAYAAFAYALHSRHGRPDLQDVARDKAKRLAQWVISRQRDNGSWLYYSDDDTGNFIDCFHSCFVMKNLIKVGHLLTDVSGMVTAAIALGRAYVRKELYDEEFVLCRRFAKRDIRDPYRWDLYDQAEYLGLMIDMGEIEKAKSFARRVEDKFQIAEHWYCRIDVFGRRWGRGFLRWGIAPYWYHKTRLDRVIEGTV